jgi:hypothetical protein
MPPLPCVPVEASPLGAFAALPQALSLRIFARVPVDTRLRCVELSRGFRALLAERSLWTWLQLPTSFRSAHAEWSATDCLLRAAAHKAGSSLTALDVTGCERVSRAALLDVIAANAGTLRELHVSGNSWGCCKLLPEDAAADTYAPYDSNGTLRLLALLRVAPHLTVLGVDVAARDLPTAIEVLTNVPPYGPVRLRSFSWLKALDEAAAATEMSSLSTHLAAHASLSALRFGYVPYALAAPAALAVDAVSSSAANSGWRELIFSKCALCPAVALALAQLLRVGALQKLVIDNDNRQLLDQPGAALVAAGLHENTSLKYLELCNAYLFSAAGALIIRSLVGHPRLETLKVAYNPVHSIEVGKALGELVAANAPALRNLDVSYCQLGDIGLGPLVAALPGNTQLHALSCREKNRMSDAFALDVFTPAVRANTSLRLLEENTRSVVVWAPRAAAHVQARAAADEAA